jgi:hypothetical protein
MNFLSRETERNMTITDIKRWNIMNAMRGVAATWEPMSTVTRNCSSECGFGIKDAVDK